MMKKYFFKIFAAFSIFTGVAGAGPLIIGNGAGAGEFYLVYALQNFELVLEICSKDSRCAEGVDESLKVLRQQYVSSQLHLSFVDSRILGKELYRRLGRTIQINKDQLVANVNGQINTWNYGDAIAFVAERLAEGSTLSLQAVEKVKIRLAEFSEVQVSRAVLPDLELRQFSLALLEAPFSALIIEDASLSAKAQTFEIPLAASLDCRNSTGNSDKLQNVAIIGARWLAVDRYSQSQPSLSVAGSLRYECRDRNGQRTQFRSSYRISIRTAPGESPGEVLLVPASVVIVQEGIQQL